MKQVVVTGLPVTTKKPKKAKKTGGSGFFGAIKGFLSSPSPPIVSNDSPNSPSGIEKVGGTQDATLESVKMADTNAVVLSLGELARDCNVMTGEASFCSSCNAALSIFSQLVKANTEVTTPMHQYS